MYGINSHGFFDQEQIGSKTVKVSYDQFMYIAVYIVCQSVLFWPAKERWECCYCLWAVHERWNEKSKTTPYLLHVQHIGPTLGSESLKQG